MVSLLCGNAYGLPDDAHKQMQMDISDICEVSHLFKKQNGRETARVAHLQKDSSCPFIRFEMDQKESFSEIHIDKKDY